MGEVADDIKNGIICQICGVWMPDMFITTPDGEAMNKKMFDNPPGHARLCPECQRELDLRMEEY